MRTQDGYTYYITADVAAGLYAALASPTTSDPAQQHYAVQAGTIVRDALCRMINDYLNHIGDDVRPQDADDVTLMLGHDNPHVARVLSECGVTTNNAPAAWRLWVTRKRLSQTIDQWDSIRHGAILLTIDES